MRSMKDQSREPDIDLLEKRTEENEEVNNKKNRRKSSNIKVQEFVKL